MKRYLTIYFDHCGTASQVPPVRLTWTMFHRRTVFLGFYVRTLSYSLQIGHLQCEQLVKQTNPCTRFQRVGILICIAEHRVKWKVFAENFCFLKACLESATFCSIKVLTSTFLINFCKLKTCFDFCSPCHPIV